MDSTSDIRSLVKRLALQATQLPPKESPSRELQLGPLLDLEVDGIRCLLIRKDPEAPAIALSPREKEIARMVAKGYPTKTIAAVLDISIYTVSTHIRRIFNKLGVNSRTAMTTKVVLADIVPRDK